MTIIRQRRGICGCAGYIRGAVGTNSYSSVADLNQIQAPITALQFN